MQLLSAHSPETLCETLLSNTDLQAIDQAIDLQTANLSTQRPKFSNSDRSVFTHTKRHNEVTALTPNCAHLSAPRKCYIDPVALSTFQKILLTNNGTITDLIEIYTGESIKVKKLSENIINLKNELPAMRLNKTVEVLERKILLQGGMSGRNYIYAESIIVLERLDEQTRKDLLTSSKPIGKVWLENKIEIFKENLDIGKVPAQELSSYFDIPFTENLLFRTYCVRSSQKYTMMITEKFPESYFLKQF